MSSTVQVEGPGRTTLSCDHGRVVICELERVSCEENDKSKKGFPDMSK